MFGTEAFYRSSGLVVCRPDPSKMQFRAGIQSGIAALHLQLRVCVCIPFSSFGRNNGVCDWGQVHTAVGNQGRHFPLGTHLPLHFLGINSRRRKCAGFAAHGFSALLMFCFHLRLGLLGSNRGRETTLPSFPSIEDFLIRLIPQSRDFVGLQTAHFSIILSVLTDFVLPCVLVYADQLISAQTPNAALAIDITYCPVANPP